MKHTLPPDQDSAPDSAPGFVGDYLLYLLAAASDEASAQFHAQVRQAGLRIPEWRVLACLHDGDGAMITQLARIALVEQSRLTRIIVQMEQRRLVVRKGDPQDGRRVRVYLTDGGRELVTGLVPKALAHEKNLLSQLNTRDSSHLKSTLRALLAALEQGKGNTP